MSINNEKVRMHRLPIYRVALVRETSQSRQYHRVYDILIIMAGYPMLFWNYTTRIADTVTKGALNEKRKAVFADED